MMLTVLAGAMAVLTAGQALVAAPDRGVSIDGGAAPLHGSLLSPPGANGPAVLIIAGSGPTDRDGNSTVPGVTPDTYKLIAEGLAAQGIASLRFDKRGIADSAAAAPPESELRLSTYVDDAVAWSRYMGRQPGVACVILLGHSEGALIAAMAAQKTPVCGVISISGAGRPLGVVIAEQLNAALPDSMKPAALKVLAELQAGHTVADPPPGLGGLFRPSVQPYLISEIDRDPPAELAKVKAPVLILQGETDIQVKVADAQALKAGHPDATLVLLPGVNHVLKAAPLDRAANIATYADPSTPLGPGVLAPIVAFVKAAKRRS
jgi:alpha-beta hydrolase superfamily lysophospholipase